MSKPLEDPTLIVATSPEEKDVDIAYDQLVKAKAAYREKYYDYYYNPGPGPMSFEELDAHEMSQELNSSLWHLTFAMQDMSDDILRYAENVDKPEALANMYTEGAERIASLADDFDTKEFIAQILTADDSDASGDPDSKSEIETDDVFELSSNDLTLKSKRKKPRKRTYKKKLRKKKNGLEKLKAIVTEIVESVNPPVQTKEPEQKPVSTIYKESGDVKILKGLNDKYYLYGRMSNNIFDREDQVLTEKAHVEFCAYLDEYPDMAPELWTWHVKGTARKNVAEWWSYHNGFLHMMWPLEDGEVEPLEKFMDEYEPGMSHGFYVFAISKDQRIIDQYRSFEGSILPLAHAANIYTNFSIIKECVMNISPEKRAALVIAHGEERAAALVAQAEEDGKELDSLGLERKDVVAMEEVLKQLTAGIGENIEKAVKSVEKNIVETIGTAVDDIDTRLKAVEAQLQTGDDKPEIPTTSLAAWVAARDSSKSSMASTDVTKTAPDALTGPEENVNTNGKGVFGSRTAKDKMAVKDV